MYETQKNDMTAYYRKMDLVQGHLADETCHERFFAIRNRIYDEMDAIYKENPETPSVLLKSRLHTLMARYCEPVIFEEYPFFFEMGMREADSWGLSEIAPSHWLMERLGAKVRKEHPICAELEETFEPVFDLNELGLCATPTPFDIDHHTLGYTTLFSIGVNGLLEQTREQMEKFPKGSDRHYFCMATEESLLAMLTVAEKFAARAEELLAVATTERQKDCLRIIAAAAKRVPANPPETFYEGLAFLLFAREVIATLEGIGVSQLGHVDRLLGPLYDADTAAGNLTEEEAREFIGLWMLHTDIKFDLERNSWPETSTCIQLGGCDADGKPVYHTVTRLFIEEHHRLGLVNPKLNCRYNEDSPEEYLQSIGKAILKGHNNFVLINDDVMIAGLKKSGVSERDARLYVNGGCQETMIEGFGHTEGVAFYASVPRVLDLFLQGDGPEKFCKSIGKPESFEAFYRSFLEALKYFYDRVTDQRNVRQHFLKETTVCPLFSATQHGCIENGLDYSHGGAKYNYSTISLIGLATVADSLYAVKTLVYDRKRVTLNEFVEILAKNWEEREELRQEAAKLPKYGHNEREADVFANRFLQDFTAMLRVRKNERGGTYLPSLFVYYHYETFSHCLRATPDGRRAGELINAGCAPSNVREIKEVTAAVKSMEQMDFTACGGGSAVLDVKLPLSSQMDETLFAAFIRACGKYHCPTIQPNVVSQEDLLDAKIHPERHKNLIVRICGLSAYFVALTPEVQDEIIARNLYRM